MFVLLTYKNMFYAELIGVFIICLYTEFHMPGSGLFITIKLKAKYRFHMVVMLLFYILQKNYCNKVCFFF
jgi:hypothetical protein